MRKWLGGIVVLLIAGYVGWQGERVGKTLFWSCPVTYRFVLNQEFFDTNKLPQLQEPRMVLLSCDYRVTKQGAGSGEGDPMYYTEKTEWMGIAVQKLYLNVPAWWGRESGERNKVLSYFVLLQLAGDDESSKQTAVEAYKASVAPIGIAELGEQK